MSEQARVRLVDFGRDLSAADLPAEIAPFLRQLGGPTLIRQPGRDGARTRIVTTLLHANEPSGTTAVRRWLHSGQVPQTDTLFFLASVEAALAGAGFEHRFLPGRGDMNRCWLPPCSGREAELAREALALLRPTDAECLVDLHNNSGHNPAYGVGPAADAEQLNLVALWGDRFVHSHLRLGTLVEATRHDCPSVVIECGRSFDPAADEVAYEGLVRLLSAPEVAGSQLVRPIEVLHEPVRVSVRPGIALAFGERGDAAADLTVALDVDRHNFEEMPEGTTLGWLRSGAPWPLEARDENGRDLSAAYFEARGDALVARRPLVPVMMTTDRDSALADCLFYIVRRATADQSGYGKSSSPPWIRPSESR